MFSTQISTWRVRELLTKAKDSFLRQLQGLPDYDRVEIPSDWTPETLRLKTNLWAIASGIKRNLEEVQEMEEFLEIACMGNDYVDPKVTMNFDDYRKLRRWAKGPKTSTKEDEK